MFLRDPVSDPTYYCCCWSYIFIQFMNMWCSVKFVIQNNPWELCATYYFQFLTIYINALITSWQMPWFVHQWAADCIDRELKYDCLLLLMTIINLEISCFISWYYLYWWLNIHHNWDHIDDFGWRSLNTKYTIQNIQNILFIYVMEWQTYLYC